LTINKILESFIQAQSLPKSYVDTALKWFMPIATALNKHQTSAAQTIIVGINGCQGSGKSTLTQLLCELLPRHFNKTCIGMSIDDFYLSKQARQDLSQTVHPLFATRGVPGTHDTGLLLQCLRQLKQKQNTVIPHFDKSKDDLVARHSWSTVDSPVDIVILEGWCVGIDAQPSSLLDPAINSLERERDPNGIWRQYVNQQLKDSYQEVFALIDTLVFLQTPSFDTVFNWRCEQEHKLIAKLQQHKMPESAESDITHLTGIMSDAQIAMFVQYYERLTKHALQTLPAKSDIIVSLNQSRGIDACLIK